MALFILILAIVLGLVAHPLFWLLVIVAAGLALYASRRSGPL